MRKIFAISGDALARADERVAMCLFLRGDVAAGPECATLLYEIVRL